MSCLIDSPQLLLSTFTSPYIHYHQPFTPLYEAFVQLLFTCFNHLIFSSPIVLTLSTDFGSIFSGVLTDEHGRVQSLWGSFSTQLKCGCSSSEDHQFVRGIPIYTISQVLGKIISGADGPSRLIYGLQRPMPRLRILEVELYPTLLSKARSFGLNDTWIQALV